MFLKQLSESKFTEPELNAQVGSALCSWVQNRGGSVIGVGGVRGVGGGIGVVENLLSVLVLLISIWDHKNAFELEVSSDFNPYLYFLLYQKKMVGWKVEVSVPNSISSTPAGENDLKMKNA
ncbi:hypothetical protein DKX38_018633 [Salix brachista]|uniref:Uncharacterized protein n=1 Tax=Salix brachista TaxID=2182728 RepID=A0A5N5KNK9_9ROSI|nr:hypothetical protein DKX38_018633 [Salix brachista]